MFLNLLIFSHIFLVFSVSLCLGSCYHENKLQQNGAVWNSSCSICHCDSGNVSCSNVACPILNCASNEVISRDSCCPQCTSSKGSCADGSASHTDTSAWFGRSRCILYQCQDGSIIPHLIQCPSLICSQGETLITPLGKCCPVCVSDCKSSENDMIPIEGAQNKCSNQSFNVSRNCNTESRTKEEINLLWKDPCTLCVTSAEEINCYVRKCPLCDSSSTDSSECCPCSKNLCSKECLKCADDDINICTECRDLSSVVLDGQCVSKCPDGFYEDEKRQCKKCPSICKNCFGSMSSQCSSCHRGFFLQQGRCVKECGPNFFASGNICLECHESCGSCEGPNHNDCIICALSGQLLQNGECVDNCVGHFYVSDNNCMECNESCARCLKDGTCQYCEQNYFLEEEECVPECSASYYTFLDAYCISCHSDCQGCYGPLAYQCTSCPFGQFLLENSCVWDCGQGYFGDLGAGICRTCHADCRSCLGGSSADKCLTCSSGYLLPYIGTHFGPCVENCPSGYFLSEDGVCMTCHESCESCFGANDTDCRSCITPLYYKHGRCVPHCSAGYFQDGGICYACHPSCSTCYGFSEEECYTCPHGRNFKYGRCISECEDGKFLDVEGSCRDCHASCNDCMLNHTESDSVQCLQCKNQQLSILNEECVHDCPPNYYLNSYRFCQECHPTCATCERSGASSCVSCWKGSLLTHLGTCEPYCHRGYFPANGLCQACNSDCHHCTDASKCLQCKGDLVLEFGKCVWTCTSHHYVDAISRRCKECPEKCSSCRGPSDTDCLSCVDGSLLEDGSCIDHCSDGFYENDGVCETCDLKCKTCSSLNKCTSCDLPLLLLDGQCVDDCGNKRFADFDTLKCESCSEGCLYCTTSEECDLCQKGYFLQERFCVNSCPDDLYGDPVTRICRNFTDVSKLMVENSVMLQLGHSLLITTDLLNLSNATLEKLFIMLADRPKNTQLLKILDTGNIVELKTGDNFTSNQLQNGWVFFKHLNGLPIQGKLSFIISNGHTVSDEIILPIHVVSEFPPVIEQLQYIVVPDESTIIINSSSLHIDDLDNIQDITLKVIEGPCNRVLIRLPDEKEMSTVPYKEFSQNQLAFKSLKSDKVSEGNILIQAYDGFNTKLLDLKVFVVPKDQTKLFVARNNPLYITAGNEMKLNNKLLLTVGDNLYPSNTHYHVQYSIGTFYKKKSKLNTESQDENIIELKSFSQEDIDYENIYYYHPNTSVSNAIINFMVKNSDSQEEYKFDFEVFVLKPETSQSNVTNQFGMMVLQNHPATITNDHLLVHIDGIPSNDIVYMITKKLLNSEGTLENTDKPGERIQSFTQKDINDLKIVYHPPPLVASSEKEFTFKFVVIDAISEVQLSPVQDFVITITPASDVFTSPASSITHKSTVHVRQGEIAKLGPQWLTTDGHEMPEDQLEVVLINAPQHGNLVQITGGTRIEIGEEDGFAYSSIVNDMYYEHDGSNNIHDNAVFSIMGGKQSTLNSVIFEIRLNDVESPVILDSTTLMGSIVEGKSLNILRHHLAFTDLVSGDKDIMFTLIASPKHGILEKKENGLYYALNPKDQFSQQDINEQIIRYTASTDIGNDVVREFVYFDVSDASGNVQANQVLTIKVKPKKKEPPTVKITTDVQVNEGGEAVIEPHVITVFDPDSALSDLTVVLDTQPDYGFIENSRPIPGAENSLAGIPISSFPYIDLIEGFVKYIQTAHHGVEPERDSVYIHINDGYLSSSSHLLNITIKPMNDETPHVFTDYVIVDFGRYTKISNSSFSVIDVDTKPDDLEISILNPPQQGSVKTLNQSSHLLSQATTLHKGDVFSFLDIMNELLFYEHSGKKPVQNDTLTFSVSDGHHTIVSDIHVLVFETDKETPFILRNLGVELIPGNSTVINNNTLSASDIDSPDNLLLFSLTSDPLFGQLFLTTNGEVKQLSSKGKNTFSQEDINLGNLKYHHNANGSTGVHHFRFNIRDPANNTLLNQMFFITVSDDIFPPIITRNTGLEVLEHQSSCITHNNLTATDEHQKNLDLIFTLTSVPSYGYLENKKTNEMSITDFKLSDLKLGIICYVHTKNTSDSLDHFSFTISDGKNWAHHNFYISIIYKSNIPILKIKPLYVKEGSVKVISEFELDIVNKDTQDEDIIFRVVEPPKYGFVRNSEGFEVDSFSVADLKQGKIFYQSGGSDVEVDELTFTVSDNSNKGYIFTSGKGNITSNSPLIFPINIIQVDDVVPVLVRNKASKFLGKNGTKVWSLITNDNILVKDSDTSTEDIIFRITLQPQFGYLQLSTKEGQKITQFTQRDINEYKVLYILKDDNYKSTKDEFIFSFEDTKPNKVFNNLFTLEWSRVSFKISSFNVSEVDGFLELPVKCLGYCWDTLALCKIKDNLAKRDKDILIHVSNEVYFDVSNSTKNCVFKLVDDTNFDGLREYTIELQSSSLVGEINEAVIQVNDKEDEPSLSFKDAVFKVNESELQLHVPVQRKGDLRQEISLMCVTSDITARGNTEDGLGSGSDYISRFSNYKSFITFPAGITTVDCIVEIIDDNIMENKEEFLLSLTNPHPFGQIRGNSSARIIINGPNDVSEVFLKKDSSEFFYGKHLPVIVVRKGVDLSQRCIISVSSELLTSKEGRLISSNPIEFYPFETTVVHNISFNFEENQTRERQIGIYLNSPSGCVLGNPRNINFTMIKEKIKSIVQFNISKVTVKETDLFIDIPITRTGDTSQNSSMYCVTRDGSATSREDYEERYVSRRTSIILFLPDQKLSYCRINLYDDDIYETKESFQAELKPNPKDTATEIGETKLVHVHIIDEEDVTRIELDKKEFIISDEMLPSSGSLSVRIPIVRRGDLSVTSKIRVSTIDGSASSGEDYHAKSKLLNFLPGEQNKTFYVDILYNKRRNWSTFFTVLLGPDEVVNAKIGNVSKALIRIAGVQSSENLILPTIPVVVSLLYYDNVSKGMSENPTAGYPLVCVSPCDENYPNYFTTNSFCTESKINSSIIRYSWEIAMPSDNEDVSDFETVVQSTLYTSAHEKILDSIYFRPQERIRCIAQPQDEKGSLGIPLKSDVVKISSDIGFCHSSLRSKDSPFNLQIQPFLATLNHLNSSDLYHPNELHIHVEIPHEDGLLPLLSTYPLHNVDFLLTQHIYRQQHICSNLQSVSSFEKHESFIKSLNPLLDDINSAFPFNGEQCPNNTRILYQHLNLKKCKWEFDAWYTMAELVELCGGTVTTDFKVRDSDQTYLTVLLPLYVTYVFATAPTGWTSVEHRTELEFSFFYNTFLWKSGAHSDTSVGASVSLIRVSTNSAGHMFFEFKTVAKFYGCFVLDHHTLPSEKSYVSAPENLHLQFHLELLWSEQTFDGPIQFWRATSDYNFKDYSGYYSIHLIPCKVTKSGHSLLFSGHKYLPCIAQKSQTFDLPLTYQVTNRPQPVTYALETFFQLFNDKNLFMIDPMKNSQNLQYVEYKGPFSKGDRIYGRVFWSPDQGLDSAYELSINEVIICSGKDGHSPTFDPTGKVHGNGSQYGCLLPSNHLKYKFTLLDRHDTEITTKEVQGIPFNSKFVSESSEYSSLSILSGVDGFIFNVDPLYEISSNQEWFLQVVYQITPIRKTRLPRSLDDLNLPHVVKEKESSVKMIVLRHQNLQDPSSIARPVIKNTKEFTVEFELHHLLYFISTCLIILSIVIMRSKKAHIEKMLNFSSITNNSYAFTVFNKTPFRKKETQAISEAQNKHIVEYKGAHKVKISMPRNNMKMLSCNPSETEV
ncbi:extracellular matrix organizing protein FRAS1 [Parasteatoda tepidariorum]|uniref:extracellular matrix organizing protein FRAS1 n=1 Tax=Parasteatoda tepidariorum TaxID=114398 RepID=UPI0039BCF966